MYMNSSANPSVIFLFHAYWRIQAARLRRWSQPEDENPFYHSLLHASGQEGVGMSWQLSFPLAFFRRLCLSSIQSLRELLIKENRNPMAHIDSVHAGKRDDDTPLTVRSDHVGGSASCKLVRRRCFSSRHCESPAPLKPVLGGLHGPSNLFRRGAPPCAGRQPRAGPTTAASCRFRSRNSARQRDRSKPVRLHHEIHSLATRHVAHIHFCS